ncbi:MAG: CrcB family protein [Cellvibrionaceae bacterium]|nr:CrcB family protein [Cellvibrionaceae bacterium]
MGYADRQRRSAAWPWACLPRGWCAAPAVRRSSGCWSRPGVLGGFTTFSAFSLDFAVLYERGALTQAFSYVAASVLLSIGALFVGLWVARNLA